LPKSFAGLVLGPISIFGQGGNDDAVLHDRFMRKAIPAYERFDYYLTNAGGGTGQVERDYTSGSLRSKSITTAVVQYSGVENLQLLGRDRGTNFYVQGTLAGSTTTIQGGIAIDRFNIGDASHSLGGIQGELRLDGGDNTDTLAFDDSPAGSTIDFYSQPGSLDVFIAQADHGPFLGPVRFHGQKADRDFAYYAGVGLIVTWRRSVYRGWRAAAAEAMRRILIESTRYKRSKKHGGQRLRISIDDVDAVAESPSTDLLALDEALNKLAAEDPVKARLVTLRYFAGLSVQEAADVLGISRATADRYWSYARTWLFCELGDKDDGPQGEKKTSDT
jgi:RNA polymerase sigma factor (sigma-70 family)